MQSKFTFVKGVRLAYREKNADRKECIVFIHGNSGSSATWHYQFNDPALERYRLIAFDLPAHGNSSASQDPREDYSVTGLGKLMAQAIQNILQHRDFILCGVSMGTNVIAEMLSSDLHPGGIVLSGPCVIGGMYGRADVFQAGADTRFLFEDNVPRDTAEQAFRKASPTTGTSDTDLFIDHYLAVLPPFRSTLLSSIQAGAFSDEPALLQRWGLPALVVMGKDERVVNPDYLDTALFRLWQDQVMKLAGGHFIHLDNPIEFNRLLSAYAHDRWPD